MNKNKIKSAVVFGSICVLFLSWAVFAGYDPEAQYNGLHNKSQELLQDYLDSQEYLLLFHRDMAQKREAEARDEGDIEKREEQKMLVDKYDRQIDNRSNWSITIDFQ